MTVETDPALYRSNFERNKGDRYYTEPWVTEAFIRTWGSNLDYYRDLIVWEPACGAGDMVNAFEDQGYVVNSSDIDVTDFEIEDMYVHPHLMEFDFLYETLFTNYFNGCPVAIVTNPPYTLAEEFIRKALDYMNSDDEPDVRLVAMLLRSEYHHAKRRQDLFTPEAGFVGETILTSRPRWDDWWNGEKPRAAPRHNFSWFVWQKLGGSKPQYPVLKFAGKEK